MIASTLGNEDGNVLTLLILPTIVLAGYLLYRRLRTGKHPQQPKWSARLPAALPASASPTSEIEAMLQQAVAHTDDGA